LRALGSEQDSPEQAEGKTLGGLGAKRSQDGWVGVRATVPKVRAPSEDQRKISGAKGSLALTAFLMRSTSR